MRNHPKVDIEGADRPGSLLTLALLAPIVGAGAGLIGAAFRLALEHADDWRNALIAWARSEQFTGSPARHRCLCGGSCPRGRSGSPILTDSHREAASRTSRRCCAGELPQVPFHLIAIKFVGGLLAIGSGLALGREGPSVQMGANVGASRGPHVPAQLAGLSSAARCRCRRRPGHRFQRADCRRHFRAGGIGAAVRAAYRHCGARRFGDCHCGGTRVPRRRTGLPCRCLGLRWLRPSRPLYFVLGAIAGLVAILYNRTLLGTIAAANRLDHWPVELRAAAVGAAVGALGWFCPG